MRTDVKLGVVISLAIVLVAGGYYVYRDQQHGPIPITAGPDGALHAAKSAQPSGSVPQTAERKSRATGADRRTTKRNVGSSPATRGSNASARKAPADQPQQQRVAAADRSKRTPPQGARKTGPRSAQTKRRPGETAKKTTSPSSPAGAKPAPTKQAASERVTAPGKSPRTADRRRTPQDRTLTSARKSPNEKPPAATRGATKSEATPPEAAVDIHRVQPGDTFSSLAAMYYGDVKYTQFLMDRNASVGDPKRLAVGVEIRIPALPVTTDAPGAANPVIKASSKDPTAPRGKTYTVKAGDTFYAIARDELGNAARWRELLALNTRIVNGDPTRLQVNQVITLPD